MSIDLRKHNQDAYEKVKDTIGNSNRAAVIHPTGTGKSYIALKLLEENKGKKAIYLAPSNSILHNIKRNIFDSDMDMTDFPGLKRITYAKLMRMSEEEITKLGADIIILDEFHHCGAPEWGAGVERLLQRNPDATVLGLSATPIRYFDEARDMAEELFGENIASEMTLEEAIDQGILPEATYVSALYSYKDQLDKMQQDIEKIENTERRAEAQRLFGELKGKLDESTENLPELLSQYMTNKSGKYIVFCKNIEDMKQKMQAAQEMFGGVNSNITTYSVSSEKDIRLNDRTLSAFEQADDDSLKLMFAVDMLNEGYHISDLDGVVMMRPTFSPTIFAQQLGRALSVKKEDGKAPVILDLVDNFDSCKVIEDFCEKMKQYKGRTGDGRSNAPKKELTIFDKTKEFREIANRITVLSRSKVFLEEKIEIFKRFSQTGEELTGQTIFEGYPIGQWATQMRSLIKNKRSELNASEEQMEQLIELGILDRKIDSTIDEKIDELVDWSTRYPKANVHFTNCPIDVLREYAQSEEELKMLQEQYERMQKHYEYVRVRKSQRKINTRTRNSM